MFSLKREDGQFFSLFGWTPAAHQAMQWTSAVDAKDYATTHAVKDALPVPSPRIAAAGVDSTTFNPFSTRKA